MKTRIVIHNGGAHFDELLAVSLIIGHFSNTLADAKERFEIVRRDPVPEELEDSSIWVIDVGGKYQPDKLNFDHHHERALPCAFVLIAKYLGIDKDAESTFLWWPVKAGMDTNLYGTWKTMGIDPDKAMSLMSPVEGMVLKLFEDNPMGQISLLYKFGKSVLGEINKLKSRLNQLRKECKIIRMSDHVTCIDHTIPGPEPSYGMNAFRKENWPPAGMSITPDDRGDGWALYRYEDHPNVDFSKLKDDPGILFAHPGGFIAKTHKMTFESAVELAKKALKNGGDDVQ